MVADEHRGLVLEMSLTKLVQAKSVQIIGMSATIGGEHNLDDVKICLEPCTIWISDVCSAQSCPSNVQTHAVTAHLHILCITTELPDHLSGTRL